MPKHSFSKLPPFARYLTVSGISLLFASLLCLVMSFVAKSSGDPTANLSLYGEIIFALSMLFCGFTGAKSGSENKLLSGILSSALLLLIVFAVSLLFSGETSVAKEIILALIGSATACAGAFLGSSEKKRRRKR
ncbi:MAG: TIGR04086 family membrane protein [Clostridia bacterium]|nr:TIGR04086 family membrane protein [Clostridia bacterium]MBQ6614445.1 TIGR04086 family membrane protein [Clostridia bacterium]